MRKIQDKSYEYIDKKLLANGAAQEAIRTKNARALLIYAAEACVGIREVGGNNRGPMVELFQKTVDGKAQSEAWCMAFVQSIIAYVERKLGVKSPIAASEHCMTTWRQTPTSSRVRNIPAPGAIVIWKKGSTDNGHTGFVTEWFGKSFEAVEGNTESGLNPKGEVERDGGGVYLTNRSAKGAGSMKIVGYLKPFAA